MTETRLDLLLSWRLSRAAAYAHKILAQELREAGSSGYEYRVLASLAAASGRTQTSIGQEVGLDRRDVSDTVRALEDRGLVRRARDEHDKRAVTVELTETGNAEWERLDAVMEQVQAQVGSRLGPDRTRQLSALLADLVPPVD